MGSKMKMKPHFVKVEWRAISYLQVCEVGKSLQANLSPPKNSVHDGYLHFMALINLLF